MPLSAMMASEVKIVAPHTMILQRRRHCRLESMGGYGRVKGAAGKTALAMELKAVVCSSGHHRCHWGLPSLPPFGESVGKNCCSQTVHLRHELSSSAFLWSCASSSKGWPAGWHISQRWWHGKTAIKSIALKTSVLSRFTLTQLSQF